MVTVLIQNIKSAEKIIISGYDLSKKLKKEFGVIHYLEKGYGEEIVRNQLNDLLKSIGCIDSKTIIYNKKKSELAADCEILEASFLLIQWNENDKKSLKSYLKFCRDLRIPYLFFKDSFAEIEYEKVLVPVGFLIEEYEKTQFASAFGRFCGSEIMILLANDYGSKAATTAEKMKEIFDKFQLNYALSKAKSDSFKLENEAVKIAQEENYNIVLVSASREYGLDDILFGPKEYHLVKKSTVSLLLINPRGDLYTLCD